MLHSSVVVFSSNNVREKICGVYIALCVYVCVCVRRNKEDGRERKSWRMRICSSPLENHRTIHIHILLTWPASLVNINLFRFTLGVLNGEKQAWYCFKVPSITSTV